MSRTFRFLAASTMLCAGLAAPAAAQNPAELRPVDSFATIPDNAKRSVALFEEAGKVLLNPRCVNCHPATERPLQGNDQHLHQPPVVGVMGGIGAPGMQCGTCHGTENAALYGVSLKSIPGNPKWSLAPHEMAWQGKSLSQICQQIKDPARNGGKDLAALHEHMAHDDLVGWAWQPGAGRTPAPGTQAAFGALIKAWIDAGAECPS